MCAPREFSATIETNVYEFELEHIREVHDELDDLEINAALGLLMLRNAAVPLFEEMAMLIDNIPEENQQVENAESIPSMSDDSITDKM